MAVVNTKSTLVSNADATPSIHNNSYLSASDPFEGVAVVAMGAGDSIGSTYRFGRISSSARVSDIQVMNDATTAGVVKIGVLLTAADGGGVVVAGSDTIFASGVSTAAAQNTWKLTAFPALASVGTGAVANLTLRVWELLGLSADPFKTYDLAASVTTAMTAGGNLALRWQSSV